MKVEATITTKGELISYLKFERFTIQRYVVPMDLCVKRLLVRWHRTKTLCVYTITPKSPLKPIQIKDFEDITTRPDTSDSTDLSLDPTYIASLRFAKICEVREEVKHNLEAERNAGIVRGVIEKFVLKPGEVLEEVIFSLIPGINGTYFILNVPKCRTSRPTTPISSKLPIHHASISMPEIALRVTQPVDIHRVKPIPKRDLCKDFSPLSQSVTALPQSFTSFSHCISMLRHPHAAPSCEHLSMMAGSMDKLSKQAKECRNSLEAHLQKVRFSHYPDGFLTTCINHVYELAKKDQRLCKYFEAKEELMEHIKGAVKEAFMTKHYQRDLKEIHEHLGVRECDFDAFVRMFGKAMEMMGAEKEDIDNTLSYLNSFKPNVVTTFSTNIH